MSSSDDVTFNSYIVGKKCLSKVSVGLFGGVKEYIKLGV